MKEGFYSKTALMVIAVCLVIMTVQLYYSSPYKCDVCGWKVSPQAAICPRCGHPDPAHDARERNAGRQTEQCQIQLELIRSALDLYQIDMNSYPDSNTGLDALMEPPQDISGGAEWQGPYTKEKIPVDPWGNPYNYKSDYDQQSYMIWSAGPNMQNENGEDGTDDIVVYSDR